MQPSPKAFVRSRPSLRADREGTFQTSCGQRGKRERLRTRIGVTYVCFLACCSIHELRTRDKAMLTAQSCTESHGHVLLGKW